MYYIHGVPTDNKVHTLTLRIDPVLFQRIDAVREHYGTPYSEQIRRALDLWLAGVEGEIKKATRTRGKARARR